MPSNKWPDEGPEVEVWTRIHEGLESADELDRLPAAMRQLAEKAGRELIDHRFDVVLESRRKGWVGIDDEILSNPWIRYALDLEIATIGIQRAAEALRRYEDISR